MQTSELLANYCRPDWFRRATVSTQLLHCERTVLEQTSNHLNFDFETCRNAERPLIYEILSILLSNLLHHEKLRKLPNCSHTLVKIQSKIDIGQAGIVECL